MGIYIKSHLHFDLDSITLLLLFLIGGVDQESFQQSTPEENLMSFITQQESTQPYKPSRETELSKKIDLMGR
jgi:hypothetical protein